MRESDLRVLFKRQAATELPPAPISIPAARRIGRARLLRRRAGAIGSPVLAAAAVVGVVLAVVAASPRQPTAQAGPAPQRFNPLVPYAAMTWYPYQPRLVGSNDWRTTLMLRASTPSPAGVQVDATQVVLYAAGWCTLKSASLSCGATTASTRAQMTVTGTAPDVQGQPAYWADFTGGNLSRLRALAGIRRVLAFQYARGGWALVQSTGTPADLVRVAGSLRYNQTASLRFPVRLTGLPSAWSDVLYASVVQPAPGVQEPTQDELVIGSPANLPGTPLRNPLTIITSTQPVQGPKCRIATSPAVRAGKNSKPASKPTAKDSTPTTCPSSVINGDRAYLNTPPDPGKQTLFSPDADGLYVYLQTWSPQAPLSPTAVFAHDLRLLGPDPAMWTTAPLSP